jgi:hypothetical protein
MDMWTAIVVVTVDVPSFPVQFPRQGPAERDQQEPHTGLRNELKPVRDANVPRQHHCPDKEEGRGMADPPPEPNGTGRPKGRALSQDRRNSGKMVGIERMPQAEQEPQP